MKKLLSLKLFKKGILFMCFFQLAFGQSIAMAQTTPTSQTILESTINVVGQGLQIYDQNLMQQAMIHQMQAGARAFSPNLAPQSLVSQCNMPQKPDPMPIKCEPPVGQVNPMLAAQSMASTCNAEKALNYLKGALPDGQASSTVTCPNPMLNGQPSMVPTGLLPSSNYGLKCMDNFRENLALQIQNGVMNDLKRIKSQMAQELGRAREVNKKVIGDIEDVASELNGSKDPDSGIDIAQYFEGDAACKLAMDQGALANMDAGGLRGVEKMFEIPRGNNQRPISSAAGDYVSNRAGIKKDLQGIITKMSGVISEYGADGFVEDLQKGGPALGLNTTEFAGLKNLIGQTVGTYQKEKDRVTKKFTELGLRPPELTEDFDFDSQDLLNSSTFMNNCFQGGKSGTSMSLSDLSFKTKEGFGGGTVQTRVKKRLDEILSNEEMEIEDKLSEIRSLDQTILRDGSTPIVQVAVDISGVPSNVSISEFYQFQQQNCEKKFKTSDESENFKEAEDLLRNLKDVGSTFQESFSDLAKKIENCDGASLRNNPNACSDGSALDPGSESFCIDTADRCASSIQSCFKKAKNIVKQKEAQRQDLANVYNANMGNLQAVYDTQIIALNQSLSGFQKGLGGLLKVAEVVPGMDRIGVLSMQKSPFGVDLIDGGSFDRFEKEVPQAIDSMLAAIEQQGKAINDKINEEAQSSELPRIQSIIAEFEEIKKSCQGVYQKMQADVAQQQQEQQELFKKASEVCSKARNMFAPTVKPGCEELKSLATEMHEVANVLTPNAMGFANGIGNYCDQQEQADDPEGEDPIGNLARACSRGGPDGAKKELEALKTKLLGESSYNDRAKLDPTFADSPQGRAAETIEAALNDLEKAESSSATSSSSPSTQADTQTRDELFEEATEKHAAAKEIIGKCNKKYKDKQISDMRYNEFNTSAERVDWVNRLNAIDDNCSTPVPDDDPLFFETHNGYNKPTSLTELRANFILDSDTDTSQPCYKLLPREKRETCQTSIAEYLINANEECANAKIPTPAEDTFPEISTDYAYCDELVNPAPATALSEYNAAKTDFEQHNDTRQQDPRESNPSGKICEQLEQSAKVYAFGSRNGSASDTSDNGACYENVQVAASSGATLATSERRLKSGCDPNEKFSERMNKPTLPVLRLIDGAIGMGRNVSGNGASSPYLNAMGENLAGVCHTGETPNPSDVTNPFAPPPVNINNQMSNTAIQL